ncbi:YhaN family protein [Aureimonas phyllosphaerae]|uniref:Uncharacterized protein YhaN n=1 Tax=Aureimonas phyllosphaerae TaxID=1166078 RepID=A0A7W6FWR7_9HYPH|nr:YhaN family protein [Aureimonas phyllosphaerae]MBB3938205.1 uncharacterized protein YhaN [Aureimonas phyllosphaerae]MBB3962213.1 uncharacterized protein YhaN [Aureimonas phyllosphaerae]SFF58571.1 Uncharacterized protein YhaN [Aureimonas phyllosphaerae]
MRFRKLELIRYGGFADRVFDFGEGGPDLHLVVGPNEAGKSTALAAIGDLLFGIPGQSSQNWRYDYSQLRLRALIEHDGETIDVTRRKGNRDTLLQADGTPYTADPLAALLGGLDRTAFERMFGLDHTKLRRGGEGILSGRDDAARITLEAGTGLSHIGTELKKLEEAAVALFKPAGQNPPVNRLLRERTEALGRVRQSSIGDADWTKVRQRRTDAEMRRQALIEEAEAMSREQARLDRIARARAPFARLKEARRELDELRIVPDMAPDAGERFATAKAERGTLAALVTRVEADIARVAAVIDAIEVPGPLIAERAAIEALDERRPVIATAAMDLERRRAELERIDAQIASARAEAHLRDGVALPTAGWRRRAVTHLDARRDLRQRETIAGKERARIAVARAEGATELARLGDFLDAGAVNEALATLPMDAEKRLGQAEKDAARRHIRANGHLEGLRPWAGTAAVLARLELPSAAEAGEAQRTIDTARNEAFAARKEAEAAETTAIREKSKLATIGAGDTLPTPDAIAAQRASRDRVVDAVRERLASERRTDDEATGHALREAVAEADRLADRRDGEATRIAEHGLAVVALAEAEEFRAAAETRRSVWTAELERAEAEWAARLGALGFERPIVAADFANWLMQRTAALEAGREAAEALETLQELRAATERSRSRIRQALAEAGGGGVATDDPGLIERARRFAALSSERATARERIVREMVVIDRAGVELELEEKVIDEERMALDTEIGALAEEAGLAETSGEIALVDALAALEGIAEETATREGVARQIVGIERDRIAFEADLDTVLGALRQARKGRAVDQVQTLAAGLDDAIRDTEEWDTQIGERTRLTEEFAQTKAQLDAAETVIGALMRKAGVADETALDQTIAKADRRAFLRTVEREALVELAGADNNAGLDALAVEIAELSVEEEAAARSRIQDRRPNLASEREEVGRALNAVEEEMERAASDSAAANAQQEATEAAHQLAEVAEEHVRTASAAALLRWMLDRHRATNQAPLIARAGALFAKVTGGAFVGLGVGYAADDRPVILARRADGAEVGVEALSEGTRDQLYLALRLGTIEGRSGAATLPVICDDLLITADDARAACLFEVLAAAAAHTQVIVFSHHEHLIEVARKALGAGGLKLQRIVSNLDTTAAA